MSQNSSTTAATHTLTSTTDLKNDLLVLLLQRTLAFLGSRQFISHTLGLHFPQTSQLLNQQLQIISTENSLLAT